MAAPMSRSCATITSPGLDCVSQKLHEVRRHRFSIMRDQNSTGIRSDEKHLGIGYTDYASLMSTQEIDRRFQPAKTNDNLEIEIGVRLESRLHARGVWALERSSVSLE